MRVDGSDLRQLTCPDGEAESRHPAWSPDGTRICFALRRGDYSSLYLMDRDGAGEERLTAAEGVDDEFPAWSPDGRRIAFSRCDGRGAEDLSIICLDRRDEQRLTGGERMDYRPAWSPDGRLMAFRRSLGRSPGIYVLPVAGGKPWFVIEGRSPNWHPQGGRIALSDGVRLGLVGVDSDGQAADAPVWLTYGSEGVDHYPCWSPDGQWLAFERERIAPDAGEPHIFTMRADGDQLRDLGEGYTPAWSPAMARTEGQSPADRPAETGVRRRE